MKNLLLVESHNKLIKYNYLYKMEINDGEQLIRAMKKDKTAFFAVLDAFIGKKKLKDALSNVLLDVK